MTKMPFKHPELDYLFVDLDHPFMASAKRVAETSTCFKQRTGAIIVDFSFPNAGPQGWVVGTGNNGVANPQESCPRQNMETGTGYDLCFDKCGGNLHAEVAATKDFNERSYPHVGHDLGLFLYGHWWCCEDCCNAMKAADIRYVFILDDSGPETRWF